MATVATFFLRNDRANYGATSNLATLVSGTAHPNYPVANLTDHAAKSAFRMISTSGTVCLPQVSNPTLFALFGHNIDVGRTITLYSSPNANLSSPTVTQTFAATEYATYYDLRDLTGSTYWGFSVSGNSKPLLIGEAVLGRADAFVGCIEPAIERSVVVPSETLKSLWRTSYRVTYGSRVRQVKFTLRLTTEEEAVFWPLIRILAADASTRGPFVVVPTTNRPEVYFAETLADPTREAVNSREARITLELVEECFGVVHPQMQVT